MKSLLLGAMRKNVLRDLHPGVLILVMLSAAIGALFPAVGFASLVTAVLPASRSVQVGDTATVFATVINTGPGTATGCSISPVTSVSAQFLYQTTDPATNALTGTPNTPVDILEGVAQSFLFAFTSTAPFAPIEVELNFDCTNTSPAVSVSGLNTLLLSSSSVPVPDIIALSATSSGDGIVSLPGTVSSGAFATATVNVGSSSTITVFADTGNASLPVVLSICETNPATGACLASPGNSVTTTIAAGSTPTFSLFISANGEVPLDPAANRVFVRFRDSGGVTRGSTSVALTTAQTSDTPPPWITGQGPFGGLINSMVIDSQGRLFVATGSSGCNGYSCGRNGIFRSTDAGVTWIAANEGLTNVHVNSLATNSVDEIFSGTYFGGVFKSIDSGNNWNSVNTGLPDSAIVDAITIDSTDTVFAGLRSGEIFRSSDGGAHWKEVYSGLGSIRSIFADSNDTIFMRTLSGGHESRDVGNTWTRIGEFGSSTVSSFMQTQTGDLLSGTAHGVFRSTNGGLSWSLSDAGLPGPFPRVNTIVQANNGELVAGTQDHGFYRSVDVGINWAATGTDSPRLHIIELQRSPSDGLFAATDGGVLHSIDNGAVWSYRNEGLANSIVKAIIVSTDGSVYAGAGAGVARSTDLGLTWSSVSQGLPRASGVSALIELPGGVLLAGTESTEVYKSIDKGASWQPLGTLPAATGSVTAIGRNSQGSLFLTTSKNSDATGVYRSTDGGGTWIAINNGIQDKNLRSLAVDADDTLFAAGKGIYRSLDGGESWQLVHDGGNSIVWGFAVTTDTILAATTAGIVQTTDGGANWSAVSGAPQSWIQSMAISDTGDAYLGFFNQQPSRPSVGQYRYESNVFIPVSDPFANDVRLTPLSLVVGPDGRVYAGLSGGGVAVR